MSRALHRTTLFSAIALCGAALAAGGCGDVFSQRSETAAGSGGDAGGAGGATTSSGQGASSSVSSGGAGSGGDAATASTTTGAGCQPGIDEDFDGDGFSVLDGDCDDCNPEVSPKAFDFPENEIDEDCSGLADDPPSSCDSGLAIESPDPIDGARAIGLCKDAGPFGLVSASYGMADGTAFGALDPLGLGHGILPDYGPNVNAQEGAAVLALSTGTARRAADLGYVSVDGFNKAYTSGAPPGFPKPAAACPNVTPGSPRDSVALEVKVLMPSNAHGLRFLFDYYTRDFPAPLCDKFNDFFVAHLTPTPAGLADGNIALGAQGDAIGVNAGLLRVCTPQSSGGQSFSCVLGNSELAGTGFDQHAGASAATGWMESIAPAAPESVVTLRFAIWDSGDGSFDSTVLIDDFSYVKDEPSASTVIVASPK